MLAQSVKHLKCEDLNSGSRMVVQVTVIPRGWQHGDQREVDPWGSAHWDRLLGDGPGQRPSQTQVPEEQTPKEGAL